MKRIVAFALIILLGACVPAPITTPTPKIASPTLTSIPTAVVVVPTATPQPSATPTIPPTPTVTPVPVKVSTKQTVNVRQGPGTQFAVVGKLQPNTNVLVLGKNENGQWLQVALPDATNPGWVSISVVSVNGATEPLRVVLVAPTPTSTRIATSPSSQQFAGMATTNLNVRAGPGTDYPRVGSLKAGESISIVAKSADSKWWKFSQGWVSADYIRTNADSSVVPVIASVSPPIITPRAVTGASPVPQPASTPIAEPTSAYPSGATAICNDGWISYSAHRRGTCSHHGGVRVWLRDVPP